MGTYVLVHGSWGGAWCWDQVTPLLERAGHRVVAPDLPAHGKDTTPLDGITLQSYTDRVGEALDAQDEPVILVGHSHGGVVITQAAEEHPDRVKRLVYLCAYLPGDGESLLSWAQRDPDPERNLLPYLVIDQERGVAMIKDEGFRASVCNDCSEEDLARLQASVVRWEPLSSPATPVHTTAGRWGRIPRVYIECLQDRAISPALQQAMYSASPCERVLSLNAGHMAMISAPEELARHLLALA
jgi:pimeloyl-ACP methyl ester carboxylesterase